MQFRYAFGELTYKKKILSIHSLVLVSWFFQGLFHRLFDGLRQSDVYGAWRSILQNRRNGSRLFNILLFQNGKKSRTTTKQGACCLCDFFALFPSFSELAEVRQKKLSQIPVHVRSVYEPATQFSSPRGAVWDWHLVGFSGEVYRSCLWEIIKATSFIGRKCLTTALCSVPQWTAR